MKIGSDKSNRQQYQAKTIYQHMYEWKTQEEVDQFKYIGSTQTKDTTSVKEVKIRLAQAHSVITKLAVLWKNKAISFSAKD